MKPAGLILAAGGSSRLGQPKQLLEYQEILLVDHTVITMKKAGIKDITLVLGYQSDAISEKMQSRDVKTVINDQWQNGMGTSLSLGMDAITKTEAQSVMIMLCDQPKVKPMHLQLLMMAFDGDCIVASHYNDTMGVPAIFPRSIFGELIALKGDQGARKVISSKENIKSVECPDCAFDIDKPEDLSLLN